MLEGGAHHAGFPFSRCDCCVLRSLDQLHLRLRPFIGGLGMVFEYVLAGVASVGLGIYLLYALLRPEQF